MAGIEPPPRRVGKPEQAAGLQAFRGHDKFELIYERTAAGYFHVSPVEHDRHSLAFPPQHA
jgi:hypothetical protein